MYPNTKGAASKTTQVKHFVIVKYLPDLGWLPQCSWASMLLGLAPCSYQLLAFPGCAVGSGKICSQFSPEKFEFVCKRSAASILRRPYPRRTHTNQHLSVHI